MANYVTVYEEYKHKFFQLPKVFFTSERYKDMSNNAKVAWSLLRDRSSLSRKNGWFDKETGRVYFIFTNEDLMKLLNINSKTTLSNIKKELEKHNLIESHRTGFNKPNKMYLLYPEISEEDIYAIDELEDYEYEEYQREKKPETQEGQGSPENGRPENGLQDVQKMDSSNTDFNNTDLKEEEINNARKNFIQYDFLHDFLVKAGIDNETANQTIKELIDRNIETFFMKDVEAQFEHMMDKLTYGEIGNHNNFPVYFVNGLEMRTTQSGANKKHQEKKIQEYEAAMQKQEERQGIYYDWLNDE